jgi:hypothetical protein
MDANDSNNADNSYEHVHNDIHAKNVDRGLEDD